MKGAQGRRSPLSGLQGVLGRGFSRSKSGIHLPDHVVKQQAEQIKESGGEPGRKMKRKLSKPPKARIKVVRGIPTVRVRQEGRRGYTRTPVGVVKAANRRRNKAAKLARRRNRVK